MATTWRMIRVPADLADRLREMADVLMEAHATGRTVLPGEYVEEVPLHHAIRVALDDWEAHRARSRAPKRRAVNLGSEPVLRS